MFSQEFFLGQSETSFGGLFFIRKTLIYKDLKILVRIIPIYIDHQREGRYFEEES